tara:strand:+ start:373 stop:567 length:195 start_codon:yes stop_codon:yes gene_type:complete
MFNMHLEVLVVEIQVDLKQQHQVVEELVEQEVVMVEQQPLIQVVVAVEQKMKVVVPVAEREAQE